MTTKRT